MLRKCSIRLWELLLILLTIHIVQGTPIKLKPKSLSWPNPGMYTNMMAPPAAPPPQEVSPEQIFKIGYFLGKRNSMKYASPAALLGNSGYSPDPSVGFGGSSFQGGLSVDPYLEIYQPMIDGDAIDADAEDSGLQNPPPLLNWGLLMSHMPQDGALGFGVLGDVPTPMLSADILTPPPAMEVTEPLDNHGELVPAAPILTDQVSVPMISVPVIPDPPTVHALDQPIITPQPDLSDPALVQNPVLQI